MKMANHPAVPSEPPDKLNYCDLVIRFMDSESYFQLIEFKIPLLAGLENRSPNGKN